MVAFRLNLDLRPEDFSIGAFLTNEPVLNPNDTWIEAPVQDLKTRFQTKLAAVKAELCERPDALTDVVASCQREIDDALASADGWKVLFPGKRILEVYSSREGLGKPVALTNSLIKEMGTRPVMVPAELRRALDVILAGGKFGQ